MLSIERSSLPLAGAGYDAGDLTETPPQHKWKRFEDLVAHIQGTLAPGAIVERNVKMKGRSGLERQIDICVRMKAGQFELFVVIDCKDYNRKVNVKDVEAVMGLCQDVGANQSAIVTARGFSDGAMKRARDAKMNLYTLLDAEKHEWQTLVTIPILVEVRGLESVSFTFSSSGDGPFRMFVPEPEEMLGMELFGPDGSPRGTLGTLLHEKWQSDELPMELGEHPAVRITSTDAHVRTDGSLFRADVSAAIRVEHKLYVQQVPLSEIQGFKDELTGRLHTNRMVTERITLDDVLTTWTQVASAESLAVEPVIRRVAVDPKLPASD